MTNGERLRLLHAKLKFWTLRRISETLKVWVAPD